MALVQCPNHRLYLRAITISPYSLCLKFFLAVFYAAKEGTARTEDEVTEDEAGEDETHFNE